MSIRETCRMKHNRTECLACGHPIPAECLAAFPDMPASAQNIPDRTELPEDFGITLRLKKCPHCGLWQFDCEPVDYYREVIRAVGLSETMRSLRREDYRSLIETCGLSGKKFLECGCGRGEFLEPLKEFPAKIFATEANADYAGAAQALLGEEAAVMNLFPESEHMQIPGAPFDCFLSFNFLEHQPDPRTMLRCMYANLAEGGYGLITVPSFEYILEKGRYYELIRDHIANYSLKSLAALCEACGFHIIEQGRIGIGDTLRVVVRKPCGAKAERSAARPEIAALTEIAEPDGGAEVLSQNYEELRRKMAAYTERLSAEGKRLCLWGAGHQGFTVAATTALKDCAEYIIDSAPFKQGRFAPSSHLPIVGPEYFYGHPVDLIMVTAPGYVKEITARIRELYGDGTVPEICTIEPDSWI